MYQPAGLRLNVLGTLLRSSFGLRLAIRVLYLLAVALTPLERIAKRFGKEIK